MRGNTLNSALVINERFLLKCQSAAMREEGVASSDYWGVWSALKDTMSISCLFFLDKRPR